MAAPPPIVDYWWVPWQLQDQRVDFIRIRKPVIGEKGTGKLPLDKGWPQQRYYGHTESKIHRWKTEGGNVGVIARNGLIIIDEDQLEYLKALGKIGLLPETFVVKTANGKHYYYWSKNLKRKIIFRHPTLTEPAPTKKDPDRVMPLHLGEIQQGNAFVVAPGSTHWTGVKYIVENDAPVAEISDEVLDIYLTGMIVDGKLWDPTDPTRFEKRSVVRGTGRPRQPREGKPPQDHQGKNLASMVNVPIEDVVYPRDVKRDDGDMVQGTSPWHSSKSGQNFRLYRSSGLWVCDACQSGGTWVEALAVELGFLSCDECKPGCLTGSKFLQFFAAAAIWAEERGHKFPSKEELFGDDDTPRATEIQIIPEDRRASSEGMPEDLPSEKIVVIKGPPRAGKTHWATGKLIKADTGMFVTNRHAIIDHATRIFKKNGGKNAVWYEGKARSCPKIEGGHAPPCEGCELCPNEHDTDHVGFFETQETARILVNEYGSRGVLTKDHVPVDRCPYYVMREAVRLSPKIFTVVPLLKDVALEQDHDENIRDFDLLIIDEDGCADYFYSHGVPLISKQNRKFRRSTERMVTAAWENAKYLTNLLEAAGRKSEAEKQLLLLLKDFDELYYMISPLFDGGGDMKDAVAQMTPKLGEIPGRYTDEIKREMLEYVKEHAKRSNTDHQLYDYLSAILYNYVDQPCGTVTERGGTVLYITGNEMAPSDTLEWSKAFKKIIFIGATKAEALANAIDPIDSAVVDITKFRYIENFFVLSISEEKRERQRERLYAIIKAHRKAKVIESGLIKVHFPFMILTGSKKAQLGVHDVMGDMVKLSSDSGELEHRLAHHAGEMTAIYANGRQSRGLDTAWINVSYAVNLGFSTPFWSILSQSTDEAVQLHGQSMRDAIIADEAANMVLRISPVNGAGELHPKAVIMMADDAWKIDKWLGDRIIDSSNDHTFAVESITALIRKQNIGGHVRVMSDGTSELNDRVYYLAEDAVKDGSLLTYIRPHLTEVPFSVDKSAENWREIEEALKGAPRKVSEIANMTGQNERAIQRMLADHAHVVSSRKIGASIYHYLMNEEGKLAAAWEGIETRLREDRVQRTIKKILERFDQSNAVGKSVKHDSLTHPPDHRALDESGDGYAKVIGDIKSGKRLSNYIKQQHDRREYYVSGKKEDTIAALKYLVDRGYLGERIIKEEVFRGEEDLIVEYRGYSKIRNVGEIGEIGDNM